MRKHEVTIRIRSEAKPRVQEIVRALEGCGLSDVSVRVRFGMIHGVVDESREDELARVEGVESVKASARYHAL